jgi:hypothetical protein
LEGTSLAYGCPHFYGKVTLTEKQLGVWDYEEVGSFLAQGENLHRILVISGYHPLPFQEQTSAYEPATATGGA